MPTVSAVRFYLPDGGNGSVQAALASATAQAHAASVSNGSAPSFPTLTSVGLAGTGRTVATLANHGTWAPGDFYGSVDGAVWDGYNITCTYPMEFPLSDAGKTITFRNCDIYGGPANDPYVYWSVLSENGVKLVFEDCDLTGGLDSAISGSDYTLRRCNVYGGGDGLKFANRVVIADSYVRAYINPSNPDPHADGMQSLGTNGNGTSGSGALITGNTVWMPDNSTSCIILSTGSASDMRDIHAEGNLFHGGSYQAYGGYQSGVDTLSKVSNIQFNNNAFSVTGNNQLGPITSADSPVVHTGNWYYDGPSVGVVFD